MLQVDRLVIEWRSISDDVYVLKGFGVVMTGSHDDEWLIYRTHGDCIQRIGPYLALSDAMDVLESFARRPR